MLEEIQAAKAQPAADSQRKADAKAAVAHHAKAALAQ
jgi:hypothetical protein